MPSTIRPFKLLEQVTSLPTAPFAESAVQQFAREFVQKRSKKLSLKSDSAGNMLVELNAKAKGPRWVFTAHMDHPGFVSHEQTGKRTVTAHFRGYVLSKFIKKAKVVFFTPDGEIRGRVKSISDRKDRPTPSQVVVRLNEAAVVPPGCVGMFDLGEARQKKNLLVSRACDDLAGLAAALEMIDRLLKKPPTCRVAVLLTRGEEDGFVGALAAVHNKQLLEESDRIIAIECSAEQPYAQQGAGAVIRVGDKTSIFNSSLTYFLSDIATEAAKKDKSFLFQRCLMPGGTCEATVYDAFGYHTSSICIPLGNYHNMDKKRQKLAAEYVHTQDWENMVRLFVAVAKSGHAYQPGHVPLHKKLNDLWQEKKALLG